MLYHKFSSLRETFHGDLSHKLIKGIGSKDFEDLEWNYKTASKISNECIYNLNAKAWYQFIKSRAKYTRNK